MNPLEGTGLAKAERSGGFQGICWLVLQGSWGPVTRTSSRTRLYQLASRLSSLAAVNWWLGNASRVSVILPAPPSIIHPTVHLLLFAKGTEVPQTANTCESASGKACSTICRYSKSLTYEQVLFWKHVVKSNKVT